MELVKTETKDYGISEFLLNFTSAETKRAYKRDLQDFFDFLNQRGFVPSSPSEITAAHFIAYRDDLSNSGKTVSTINRRFTTLRSLWSWFMLNGHVKTNPLHAVKLPRNRVEKATEAFTDEEVRAMVEAPDKSFHGRVHRLVMVLLFHTGMRRSEICNLKVRHIAQEGDYLVIRIVGKGGKLREIPLSEYVASELAEYMRHVNLDSTDYLIQSKENERNKKPYNDTTLYKVIKRYAKRAGIKKQVSPHSCRATVITKSLENGAPITEVADLAGHSSISTTQIYWKRRKGFESSPVHKLNY